MKRITYFHTGRGYIPAYTRIKGAERGEVKEIKRVYTLDVFNSVYVPAEREMYVYYSRPNDEVTLE